MSERQPIASLDADKDIAPSADAAKASVPIDIEPVAHAQAIERRRTLHGVLELRAPNMPSIDLTLNDGTTSLGRSESCDIVLRDLDISYEHALIRRTDGGYFELVDQSSTNGTLVKGFPIDRMTLVDGDQFKIGNTRFTFRTK